jgi:hypothetical protein
MADYKAVPTSCRHSPPLRDFSNPDGSEVLFEAIGSDNDKARPRQLGKSTFL